MAESEQTQVIQPKRKWDSAKADYNFSCYSCKMLADDCSSE